MCKLPLASMSYKNWLSDAPPAKHITVSLPHGNAVWHKAYELRISWHQTNVVWHLIQQATLRHCNNMQQTPWVQQIHKMQNTHHLCRKARTHAPCVFGVCVCVCVCSLLSFWCFYIFPAWYWQILSRQLKKHSFMEGEHCHPEAVSKMWRHIHSVTDLRTVFVASFIASGQSANCRFWPRTSVDMLGL